MKKCVNNSKGMTLAEVIVATFVMSISVLGATTLADLIYTTDNSVHNSKVQYGVRSELNRYLTDNSIWRATFLYPNNLTMSCLRDHTDCRGVLALSDQNRSFIVVNSNGDILYNQNDQIAAAGSTSGKMGFNRQGVRCGAADGFYDSTNGNYKCPLRYEVSWKPLCPVLLSTPCIDPIVEVSAVGQIKSTAEEKQYRMDLNPLDSANNLNFKMFLDTPQSSAPVARTDIYIINRGETPLFDVLANDFVEPGMNLTLISAVSATFPSWATISSNKIQYTPDAIYYGSDIIRYRMKDNTGKVSSGYAFVKIMTPYTWTGLAGNKDVSDSNNWCGTVVDGHCQGRNLASKADLIFNENCTGCEVEINSNLTVSSLRMTKNFTGNIKQEAAVNVITFNRGANPIAAEDIAPYGYAFLQEGGSYTILSEDLSIIGGMRSSSDSNCGSYLPSQVRKDFCDMIAAQFLGGQFNGKKDRKFKVQNGLQISKLSSFVLSDMSVHVISGRNPISARNGIEAPGINFENLHIDGTDDLKLWSTINTKNLYWEWTDNGTQPRDSTLVGSCINNAASAPDYVNSSCGCKINLASKTIDQEVNGHSCPYYSLNPAENTQALNVTRNINVLGGGGGTWYLDLYGASVSAEIRLIGSGESQIIGRPDTDPNWGILQNLIIDKDNDSINVKLFGKIPFTQKFERKVGTIVALGSGLNASTVVVTSAFLMGSVLDLRGASLWNLDMNGGVNDPGADSSYAAYINSDVYVNGALRFPAMTGQTAAYQSNCGAIYAKGDVYTGLSVAGGEGDGQPCAKGFWGPGSPGSHKLDLVFMGSANQNISSSGTTSGFANLFIQKTGAGVANFTGGTFTNWGNLDISCNNCTNFANSTLIARNYPLANYRGVRYKTNGETLGNVTFESETNYWGGEGCGNAESFKIEGELKVQGNLTLKNHCVWESSVGDTKFYVGGDVKLAGQNGVGSSNYIVGKYTIQFTGFGEQVLDIDPAIYGYLGSSGGKLDDNLFIEINKPAGLSSPSDRVTLQNELKAKNLNVINGVLNKNGRACVIGEASLQD